MLQRYLIVLPLLALPLSAQPSACGRPDNTGPVNCGGSTGQTSGKTTVSPPKINIPNLPQYHGLSDSQIQDLVNSIVHKPDSSSTSDDKDTDAPSSDNTPSPDPDLSLDNAHFDFTPEPDSENYTPPAPPPPDVSGATLSGLGLLGPSPSVGNGLPDAASIMDQMLGATTDSSPSTTPLDNSGTTSNSAPPNTASIGLGALLGPTPDSASQNTASIGLGALLGPTPGDTSSPATSVSTTTNAASTGLGALLGPSQAPPSSGANEPPSIATGGMGSGQLTSFPLPGGAMPGAQNPALPPSLPYVVATARPSAPEDGDAPSSPGLFDDVKATIAQSWNTTQTTVTGARNAARDFIASVDWTELAVSLVDHTIPNARQKMAESIYDDLPDSTLGSFLSNLGANNIRDKGLAAADPVTDPMQRAWDLKVPYMPVSWTKTYQFAKEVMNWIGQVGNSDGDGH